mgnify:CR=1 FL=1
MDWWDCGAGRMRMGGGSGLSRVSLMWRAPRITGERAPVREEEGGDWLKGLSLRRRAVRFRGARVGSELGRAKR